MLGYGGTAKPTEVEAYTNSRTAKDLIDILDAEGITKCIAIGHDWGSRVASRLADLYEDRFIAFAFLALGYIAPCPNFDMDEVLALTKKLAGYELLGYWKFFSAPDGAEIIEKNLRSFYSVLYPDDPEVWRKRLAPLGAFRAWVESGQTTAIGSWLSNEDQKVQTEALLKGGMTGPLSWYKVWTSGLTAEEDKGTAVSQQYRTLGLAVLVIMDHRLVSCGRYEKYSSRFGHCTSRSTTSVETHPVEFLQPDGP